MCTIFTWYFKVDDGYTKKVDAVISTAESNQEVKPTTWNHENHENYDSKVASELVVEWVAYSQIYQVFIIAIQCKLLLLYHVFAAGTDLHTVLIIVFVFANRRCFTMVLGFLQVRRTRERVIVFIITTRF